MSDVKRYEVMFKGGTNGIGGNGIIQVVLAADFDALRTEFETFKADRLKAADEIIEATAAHSKLVDALQDLLNERDQRLDDAVGLLRDLLKQCQESGMDYTVEAGSARAYLSAHGVKENDC